MQSLPDETYLDVGSVIQAEFWPRCHKCDMTIESFFLVAQAGQYFFEAHCHNAVERIPIPTAIVDDILAGEGAVDFGPAFTSGPSLEPRRGP